MSKVVSLVKKACRELNIEYKNLDASGIFCALDINNKEHKIISANLGLNSGIVEELCKDKSYTISLLKEVINAPKTSTYIDANPPELYQSFSSYKSNDEVVTDIIKNHSFPMVIKSNSKSMGVNVFKCINRQEVERSVTTIFNKQSYQYDHVLLAQNYINIESEYRVLIYKKQIQFFYKKDNSGAEFNGNLSPLHYENAKAVLIKDNDLQEKLQLFINPIFEKIDLEYGGLDIAVDNNGKLWLFEINSKPGFDYYLKDNSDKEVVMMIKTILNDL